MVGQIVFIDGGAEATLRSDRPYSTGARYGFSSLSRSGQAPSPPTPYDGCFTDFQTSQLYEGLAVSPVKILSRGSCLSTLPP